MSKRPSFQFYPGDWLRDPVAGCSLEAQGLWLRLLMVAHDSERRGYLSINRLPIPEDSLARKCGCTLQLFQSLFAELERAGIPRRTASGIIYSKRMVDDEKNREDNATRQSKFRGRKSNDKSNKKVTAVSQPSSSSSSDEDIKNISSSPPNPPKGVDKGGGLIIDLPDWISGEDWFAFLQHRKQMRVPMSLLAQSRAVAQLRRMKDEGQCVASVIDQSIVNGWKGFFPVRDNFQKGSGNEQRKSRHNQAVDRIWEDAERDREINRVSAEMLKRAGIPGLDE